MLSLCVSSIPRVSRKTGGKIMMWAWYWLFVVVVVAVGAALLSENDRRVRDDLTSCRQMVEILKNELGRPAVSVDFPMDNVQDRFGELRGR